MYSQPIPGQLNTTSSASIICQKETSIREKLVIT